MIKTMQDRQPGVVATGISGTLTLTKTGTTARTATFPDAAIVVSGSASALTSGRVPFVTTGGLLTDSAGMTYSGTALTLTGTLTVPNGTAAAPGIRLTSEASGLFRKGSTSVGVATAGVEAVSLHAPGTGFGGGMQFNLPVDADFGYLYTSRTNSELRISAGSSSTNGANIQMFGSAHATATTGRLRASTSSVLEWTATGITAAQNLTVPNGTAAAPGIRLTGEASGLYRAAGSLGFSVDGVAGLVILKPAGAYGSGFQLQHIAAGNTSYIYPSMNDGRMDLYGGTGESTGGHVRIYGAAHSTKADYVEFTRGNTVSAFFNASGVFTLNTTTDASAIGTAAIVGLGGLSIAKSLWVGGTAGDYVNIANSTGELRVNGTKVITAQGAAVADATGAGDVVAQLNALLARCRAHGLIAT
jgi:hypothetical protein